MLNTTPRFAACFPENTKHLLAGEVLHWPELLCTVQERGWLVQTRKYCRVNPLATFVISAHQNRGLPKLTCYLCYSARILFILPLTEKQGQLLWTSLCIVLFV